MSTRPQLTHKLNRLFTLIEEDGWEDESQSRFLKRHKAQSWWSAPDSVVDAAIAKLEKARKAFGRD